MDRYSQSAREADFEGGDEYYVPNTSRFGQNQSARRGRTTENIVDPLFTYDVHEMRKYDLPASVPDPKLKPSLPTGPRPSGMRQGKGRNTRVVDEAEPDHSALGFLKTVMLEPIGDKDASLTSGSAQQSDDEIAAMAADLRSGEDAISFFACFGKNSPVKFVHLNQADKGIAFRPYDLEVVDPTKAHASYFTMSESGLVKVQPGQPSEFIPLAEWMRHSTLFNLLTSIRFFKYYLSNKCFCAWRANVRFKLYCQQRRKLGAKLFLGKESFCNPLLKIKEYMLEMQGVMLLDLGAQKTFESSAFVEYQAARRAEASKQFEAVMEHLQAEVQNVCTNVTNLARNTDQFEEMTDPSARSDKSKSLVSIKEEQAERRRILKRAAQEAGMLADFIRLADYVCVCNLVELTLITNSDFLKELQKQPRKTGLFETTVLFDEGSVINFSPPTPDIIVMVSQMTDAMISTVNSVSRILYTRPFTSYVQGAIADGPNVASTIRASTEFKGIRKGINEKIKSDFVDAAQYVSIFDSVRPIFEYDSEWDFEAYSRQAHSVSSIKQDMAKINTWEKELEKMRVGQTVGILHIESRKLKQILIPMTSKKMECMKGLVKDLARAKCREQLVDYKHRIQTLVQRPQHLKDFSGHCEKLEALSSKLKSLQKNSAVVDEMYRLLSSYDVRIHSEDMVQLDDLRNVQEQYKEESDAADAYIEERMTEMTEQLDNNIGRLADQVSAVSSSLDEGVYIDASNFDEPEVVLKEIEAATQKLENIDEAAKNYTKMQELFGINVNQYKSLAKCKAKFEEVKTLWTTVDTWTSNYDKWMTSDFVADEDGNVDQPNDMEVVSKEVAVYFKDAYGMHKKFDNEVTQLLKERTSEFKLKLPVLMDIGNPNLKERHWKKIYKQLRQTWEPNGAFSMENLISWNVFDHKDFVGEQSACASGEAQLEASLEDISKGWEAVVFTVVNHRNAKDLYILGGLDEISTLLEDNQVTLQTMMGSRFIMGVREEVEDWAKKLSLLSDTLDEWVQVQRSWMYLETIFGAEDIQKQLPVEAAKFNSVDKAWRSTMMQTNHNPLVIASIEKGSDRLDLWQGCNATLEAIQKSLEEYLETKRMAFPRFYFLSNDELLEILSQTRDPHAVQPHMSKCFDAIKSIDFGTGDNSTHILGMNSPEKENVKFSSLLKAEGPVEAWLKGVETCMRESLYDNTKKSWQTYPPYEEAINRAEWMFGFPAQVTIAVDQIYWTQYLCKSIKEVADGVNKNAVADFLEYSLKQIDKMVDLIRGDLSRHDRDCLTAVITIDVHARDVVRTLVKKQIDSETDFEWTRQLRYYWEEEDDNCFAKQTNTRFKYNYEYLGNSFRLVITPLTDLCYMTLTGALNLGLGGAPAGPAGTGKTETTKDLAKALAVQCVVFNCSDGLDYKIMGRFFSGLSQAGAWACFDEFNRIDIEVLSVIAQQIMCIQRAIMADLDEFDFEGNMIVCNKNFGVFITMNPGYAGRTELPDNLKALFRPVAMMVPDYRLIAEIMLFAQGFSNALPLSNKMSQLYSLSSEQLSKQDHYDFGMRAVKSVLVAAGLLKRKEPDTWEDLLLIRAMRDSNVPKFLEADLPLFSGILSDLFPGVEVPFVDYGELQVAIENQLTAHNLQKHQAFINKIIQVHETQLVRHGMMVVGETGSGKSTNIMILAKALSQLKADGITDRDGFYQQVDRLTLNPKSISAGELYGQFNLLSGEWYDGLVPKMVRECVAIAETGSIDRKWVVFDGPVDAVWIENMNTVLDDNKMLCLANSERIKLSSTMHMMFEVQDLKVASPATVSRCGMVYMEQVHVGFLSLAEKWALATMPELMSADQGAIVMGLIKEHTAATLDFISYECSEKISSSPANLMQSLLNLLTAMFKKAGIDNPLLDSLIPLLVTFSFTWSMGCNIDDNSRAKFNDYLLERFASIAASGGTFDNIYNYLVDLDTAQWVPWTSTVEHFHFNADTPYFNLLVPTADTTRYRFLLDKLMGGGNNVLYMGETGVGKSVIVQSFLDEMAQTDDFVSFTMGYSAQTKPVNLKEVFETKLEKKRKTLFGPPAGKKMLMFIDDVNMPALEVYGAQPPNELLRQVIDDEGFYDTDKLFFKAVKDVVFAACCAPPGGGRNEVSPRLFRHFNMVWIPAISTHSMEKIFEEILGGFLNHELPAMASLAKPIVEASVDLYVGVQQELLPTPAKSHYTFNLRDLSKVFQGVLMIKKKFCTENDDLLKLWLHEESRVFRDRLIDDHDRKWFNEACREKLEEKMALTWETSDFSDLLFGDYLTRTDKFYREVKSVKQMSDLLVEYLDEYNITFPSQMHLVFFNDAMAHVSRICRVLSQKRGNALLVGVGGSGRQSLTRLASFVAGNKCFSIEINRGYGPVEFHEDLKGMLMEAGCENKQCVFLFSDTQVVEESFLEDINNLLNAGEVPNLFEADEMERIVAAVRPLAKKAGKLETRDAIVQYFVQLVRENLHCVLAFSPIGASFRNRCRMFPSLVNCCTIDWFSAWPEDALYSVAKRLLDENKVALKIEEYVEPLCNMAVIIHRSVEEQTAKYFKELGRYNYTTPTSYLELIKLYVDILKEQREVVGGKETRYRGGLKKLAETEVMVAELQNKLVEMKPVLVQASKDTQALLIQVAKDQEIADEQQAVVEKDVAAANKVAADVKIIKDDCQKDLDEALPAYYSSIKALDSLDKKSIQELKSFANPPELVAITLDAVCILFGSKPEWAEAKKLMNDMKFLDKLKEFDKDNIDPKIVKKLNKYMKNPEFVPETVGNVSSAAKSICMWVRAMHTYDRVAKNIAPKKAKLAEAEGQLAEVEAELVVKKKALQAVLDKVAGLKRTLKAAQQKSKDLENQAKKTEVQLVRAEQLIDSLGGEKVRWGISADKLSKDNVNLVGNMILSAGCIAYLGAFVMEYRQETTAKWVNFCKDKSIPVDPGYSLESVLGEPLTIREWQIMGLPADEFSTENGMFATMGRRWPLMIDPQGQANKWIKNSNKENNLQVIKLSEKDFLRTLENAIRYGAPVLLENVADELDPSLEPVLLKQIFKKGGQWLLRLGDSDVPYSNEFSFSITTKLANPHYMPEICIKVTIINFTVTLSGLENQLLVDVIKSERPDLEQKKSELVVAIAADAKQLKGIEDTILKLLANSKGNILDDEKLINVLGESKVTSGAIGERMKVAEVTTKEINSTRELYRSVATRGSLIYFVIASLALVDPMYQYSLQFYQSIFNHRLAVSEQTDDLDKRLAILIADISEAMYTNICRGLFEQDKMIYIFMVCVNVQIHAGQVTAAELKALQIGPGTEPAPTAAPARWLDGQSWDDIFNMEANQPAFKGLSADIAGNLDGWKAAFIDAVNPHDSDLPGKWNNELSSFQKMLVVRALCPQKTIFAMRVYLHREFGPEFTESPPFDLEGCYNDSDNNTPLIFVLSPGADINDYLMELAKNKGKDSQLKIISLGQGQGPIAERLMETGRQDGDWVCLQNCHLAVSWLGRMEQNLEHASEMVDDVHEEFRLWLTSMPSDKFPIPVLQNGIKITNEPPNGMKANLRRTFLDMKEEEFEGSTKPAVYKKFCFAVSFFNAMILERRKFGATGWNIQYKWMNSDLKAATQQVQLYIEEQDHVPYETLNSCVAEVTYGGRITDKMDKVTASAILKMYFVPELLDDDYKLSPSGTYWAPPEGSLQEVRDYIDTLPLIDTPDTFGLNDNADITYQQKVTNEAFEIIIVLGGGGGGGGGDDSNSDSIVSNKATEMEDRLGETLKRRKFDLRDAHETTFAKIEGGGTNSMGVFLSQEIIRFNAMLVVMAATLKDLKRAIKGLIVMSGSLEAMYNAFVYQKVPAEWEKNGYPCLKPLTAWADDHFQRLELTQAWLQDGNPTSYWLSGFFFPQGFMTAVKQTYSRDYKIAIDTLMVTCIVENFSKDEVTATPKDGVYIYGLYCEAARFDTETMVLAESHPAELFAPMPIMHLLPALVESYDNAGTYSCPCYKTSFRFGVLSTTGHSTNQVCNFDIPTDTQLTSDHWVRRGTALLCMLDY